MALKEYKLGGAFTARVERTVSESSRGCSGTEVARFASA